MAYTVVQGKIKLLDSRIIFGIFEQDEIQFDVSSDIIFVVEDLELFSPILLIFIVIIAVGIGVFAYYKRRRS